MISIIIPLYNCDDFIIEAIISLIEQSNNNWEAIIIDDGSTDNSIAIVKSYAEKDPRITLLKRDRLPKGAPTCRNIGLEKAKGEYVIFFDSDDLLAPHCLEQRIAKMEQNPDDDFAVFQQYSFTNSLENLSISSQLHKKNILYCVIATDNIWQTMGAIWKRSFLLEIGGFDENYPRFQDDDLHLKALIRKDVRYTLYDKLPSDCYYRNIDRSHENQYCIDGVNSLIRYINKIADTYNSRIENRRLLLWSMNAAVTKAVNYFMLSGDNNSTELTELIGKLYKKDLLRENDFSFYLSLIKESPKFNKDSKDYIDWINTIMSQRFRQYASFIQNSPLKQSLIKFSGYPKKGIKKMARVFKN